MRRSPALLALLLLVVPLASCGGDDDEAAQDETTTASETDGESESETDAESETDTESESETERSGSGGAGGGAVPADEYAEGVCTSIGTWYDEIETSSRDLVEGASDTTNDPATGKQLVVDFLDDAIGLTDDLTSDLEGLGYPDTETGQDTAEELVTGIGDVNELFSEARADSEALPVDDEEALVTGLQDIGASLQESATAVGANLEAVLSSVDDPELAQAFEASPTCAELTAPPG